MLTVPRRSILRVSILSLSLSAAGIAGCSEDDGGKEVAGSRANAEAPAPADICELEPCGGDILGKWTIAESCLSASEYPGCDGGKIDVGTSKMRGTMEFRADGTYITTVGAQGTMRMIMPVSCLSGAACDDMEHSLAAQTGDDFENIQCALEGELCTCSMDGRAQQKTGTFTRFGEVVVASAADSKGNVHTDMFDFCVSGSTLHLGTAAGGPSPVSMALWMRR